MTDEPPLILTLDLDAESFAWLDGLRRAYFPPERNVLSAHLTLFHKLDCTQVDAMKQVLRSRQREAIPLHFPALRSLGGGVAVEVVSPPLIALRALLAAAAPDRLTAQDRQGFRPHVTIQNKVTAPTARALLERLQRDFTPRDGLGSALMVWRYLGGPWALDQRIEMA